MKLRKIGRKGQTGNLTVWIFALMFLFMIALIYIIMTKPFIFIRDKLGSNFTGTEFEETFDRINTFWRLWPVLVIFGVILWAVVSSMNTGQQFPRL